MTACGRCDNEDDCKPMTGIFGLSSEESTPLKGEFHDPGQDRTELAKQRTLSAWAQSLALCDWGGRGLLAQLDDTSFASTPLYKVCQF